MNWVMLGALGELFGAFGVIATLGYLAMQIRASTRASRQAAQQNVWEQNTQFLSQLSTDRELCRLWVRGMAGDDDLSLDELVQFRILLSQNTLIWERLYHMEAAGDVDAWLLENIYRSRREMAGARGFQLWFEERKHLLSEEFRAALEEDIAKSPGYRPAGVDRNQVQ